MIEEIKPNLFIKKTKDSYKIVYPIKKNLQKPFSLNNMHWKNFLLGGSWENAVTVIIIIALLLFISWSYNYETAECRKFIENPRAWCLNVSSNDYYSFPYNEINFSKEGDNEFNISIFPQNTS